MIKAVLFDLDGTLLDTSEGIFHCANYTVSVLGLEPCHDERQMRKFVGPPLKDCFRIVYGIEDEDLLDKCVSVYRTEYLKSGMHLCHVYEGICETIQSLRARGIRTGVCTLKYETLARMIFEEKEMTQLFDCIHGTDEKGKITKAECIIQSVRDLGLEKDEVLMVGDTTNDLEGARSAGVSFAAVTWGFGFEKGVKTDYGIVIDSSSELLQLLK